MAGLCEQDGPEFCVVDSRFTMEVSRRCAGFRMMRKKSERVSNAGSNSVTLPNTKLATSLSVTISRKYRNSCDLMVSVRSPKALPRGERAGMKSADGGSGRENYTSRLL